MADRAKRALDLALLLPTLPVYGSVIVALAVRVMDGAPVFFVQERLGRGGARFRCPKLRTMSTEADPTRRRPTRLGRWLRERGLDELPQLYSVLRGDMSLVGPRPLTAADFERLVARRPPYAERLGAQPGITGLAQVCMARGAERAGRLDAAYVRCRSAWLDLRILITTTTMNLVGKSRAAWRAEDWEGTCRA